MAETATETMTFKNIEELVKQVWKGDVTLKKSEATSFMNDKVRMKQEGIVCIEDTANDAVLFTRNPAPAVKKTTSTHKYIMPDFADEVRCLIQQSIDGDGMANLMLSGPMGTGKTEFIYELAKEFGVKVYQVNGSEGLTMYDFYGSKSVTVDQKAKQNYTHFEKGPLYKAFIEGTKLDENGNQVFDANGEPIVVGKPAFFFLDEFAAMLPEVFLGVFNRALEIPRERGKGRSMEIAPDEGRIVKSHPGLVMFFSGNTVGTGNSGRFQMGYTAQGNKMDESTRNRITGFFEFGYNKVAEKQIALGILNDDLETDRLMKFRDDIRNLFRNERIETLFTTRSIVAICNLANTFRKNKLPNWMARAVKTAIYNGLPESDKPAFNEEIRMVWSTDYMSDNKRSSDFDYIS